MDLHVRDVYIHLAPLGVVLAVLISGAVGWGVVFLARRLWRAFRSR